MSTPNPEHLTGSPVIDRDGEKLGKLADVYVDDQTGQPVWLLVQTGLFGKKETLAPFAGAITQKDAIQIPYAKDQVSDAPKVEPDVDLDPAEEARLFDHYGVATSGGTAGDGPRPAPAPQIGGDDAMTRSEEELRVGTVRRPSELVRLKKYVVTEPVTTTVPVEREVVRVEREPITEDNVDQAMGGPEISAGEHEVVLSEEEVVVDKQAVPKERLRVDTDTSTEERTVSEEIRREQIDVEREPKKR